ncbi:uncharacterized protein LOC106760702 [Vigna radiata var. radiata]|uniref:Uncharacterized protein LOC106760702 n=1 Tax=Vigna radiata var. radiata TaxID=3916 RepID=A0A1S3U0Q2_VIGRR|nr:uncharacterized protein LOC106760702 [Vigna radiata var. radiata]
MEEVEGEIQPEVGTQREEVQGDFDAAQVGREMEEAEGEVQADGHGEQVQGEGDIEAEVGKQSVEEDKVHHVDEAEVHDVHDFELQNVHEDDDEDEGGHDGDDEGGQDAGDEYEDEDENVDDSISEESESLVDVRVECDMGTSKGQPCNPEGECSMTSDNDEVHDVRGLSDIEWVSDKLDSGPDSEDDDATIPKTFFPHIYSA